MKGYGGTDIFGGNARFEHLPEKIRKRFTLCVQRLETLLVFGEIHFHAVVNPLAFVCYKYAIAAKIEQRVVLRIRKKRPRARFAAANHVGELLRPDAAVRIEIFANSAFDFFDVGRLSEHVGKRINFDALHLPDRQLRIGIYFGYFFHFVAEKLDAVRTGRVYGINVQNIAAARKATGVVQLIFPPITVFHKLLAQFKRIRSITGAHGHNMPFELRPCRINLHERLCGSHYDARLSRTYIAQRRKPFARRRGSSASCKQHLFALFKQRNPFRNPRKLIGEFACRKIIGTYDQSFAGKSGNHRAGKKLHAENRDFFLVPAVGKYFFYLRKGGEYVL